MNCFSFRMGFGKVTSGSFGSRADTYVVYGKLEKKNNWWFNGIFYVILVGVLMMKFKWIKFEQNIEQSSIKNREDNIKKCDANIDRKTVPENSR